MFKLGHILLYSLLISCSTLNDFSNRTPAALKDNAINCLNAVKSIISPTISENIDKKIIATIEPIDHNSLNSGIQAYILGEKKSFFGTVSREELVPDYYVVKIKDDKGITHIIDPDEEKAIIYPSERQHTGSRYYSKSPNIPKMNKDKFLKGYCLAREGNQSADFAIYKKLFTKYTIQKTPVKSRAKAAAMCFGGLGVIPLTGYASYATIYESRRYKSDPSWYEQHGTNWLMGLGFMAAFHQCTNIIAPTQYQAFLALTVGVDVAANIMYEIKISDTFVPPIEEKPVVTDINDLASGLVGAANYYIVAQLFKDLFGVTEDKFCSSYLQKL